MQVAHSELHHGVLVSEILTVIHGCAEVLMFFNRFLLDYHGHPGTIRRGVCDGHVRLGTR